MLRLFLFSTLWLAAACGTTDTSDSQTLFDFSSDTPPTAWQVEDDTVMGGRSQGQLEMTDDGHARFYGEVSLENDGGFSSIRHTFDSEVDVSDAEVFLVRLHGDGKDYTLRVQSQPDQNYYYQASFPTSGDWETVRIPFAEMSAVYHGEPVDVPNFSGGPVHELQLLIGNKKAQDFAILIDRIAVE